MNARLVVAAMLVSCSMLAAGCQGLEIKPMPDRLPEEQQIAHDYGWERLVSLGDAVDREALMDAVLMRQLWHRGVDSLYLVSERQVGDVRVVMESQFDRATPDADEFLITFHDAAGRAFRQERYSSADLNAAVQLYRMSAIVALDGQGAELTPEQAMRQLQLEARMDRVREVFPEPLGKDEEDPSAPDVDEP